MYVILVYDIDETRVNRVLKTCRKYLVWVQRSVFEGEITEGRLELLRAELGKIMRDQDYVVIYRMENRKGVKREILGRVTDPDSNVI
ncbi:CRISPR-associated endonuclease Cas2 [Metallosphaera javensis (ex Sakai et al. 2022)]|uniref:CRISPR-associated endonuclease Cas2 n=1 Tax=Metallosphaera javensis (ex Sakai et al. 2022) TaxID=2775498 RepID=UPI00258D5130|nr:MAG: CRISPR-associated endoribonuclease Cas2 [Metallosphaera javensis (ex Sakai et al. 2022)]